MSTTAGPSSSSSTSVSRIVMFGLLVGVGVGIATYYYWRLKRSPLLLENAKHIEKVLQDYQEELLRSANPLATLQQDINELRSYDSLYEEIFVGPSSAATITPTTSDTSNKEPNKSKISSNWEKENKTILWTCMAKHAKTVKLQKRSKGSSLLLF